MVSFQLWTFWVLIQNFIFSIKINVFLLKLVIKWGLFVCFVTLLTHQKWYLKLGKLSGCRLQNMTRPLQIKFTQCLAVIRVHFDLHLSPISVMSTSCKLISDMLPDQVLQILISYVLHTFQYFWHILHTQVSVNSISLYICFRAIKTIRWNVLVFHKCQSVVPATCMFKVRLKFTICLQAHSCHDHKS